MSGEGITAVTTSGLRRRGVALGAALLLLPAFGCAEEKPPAPPVVRSEGGSGEDETASSPAPERDQPYRLTARPRPDVRKEPVYGRSRVNLSPGRDGFLYVPQSYQPGRPVPLALMLHGANGDASNGIGPFSRSAEERGIILLAPASRGGTWDLMLGGYGPDIEFIDRALKQTFSRYAVDPKHVAIQGFSDGASYALSVGTANGDLFSHVIAFSPGYISEEEPRGKPRIWVSHGTEDTILPIDSTSREIVPQLREDGYDVRYEEFVGPHRPWPEMSEMSLDWWLSS